MVSKIKYKRVLLKLSGEALLGNKLHGIDEKIVSFLADEIKKVYQKKIQISLVIGGGNIFRGTDAISVGIERTTADYMGMLGTLINSLALQNALEKKNIPTRVLSSIPVPAVCESYIRRRAINHLQKNIVIIFAAGTGNPYFTTDTAAALRASEISADIILKATNVDGVYSDDPKKNKNAKKFITIKYSEVLSKNLKIMDGSAIALARDNKIPIIVFPIKKKNAFLNAILNKVKYTIIK
ncbi:MAG: Uridylate kinase [Alphaproteobacteria bacterium MarineAlpha6_Bin6]|nr:MAG: Uridylate kinase [Alphaproteobacteria bacterium MarineAlpha6_Bin6]PPR32960.1 MAG: Uridylate kinase [Alphaproteobacteria bacterium MarineAlpha6_Bin5]|tara:strand:+ start:26037 stop:26753 length:717 start_codon:yes stop_codon:yes gene_type:complete